MFVLSILSFAITITNFFIFALMLFVILLWKKDYKIIRNLFIILLFSGIVSLILFVIQHHIYPNTPGLIELLPGQSNAIMNEEVRYMDFSFSLEKLYKTISNFFANTFLFGDVGMRISALYQIDMKENIIINLIMIVFWGYGIYRKIISKKFYSFIKNPIIITLFITLLSNVGLHFIYGSREQFLYSQHYSWIVFLLAFLLYHDLKIDKKMIYIFASIFFINNITKYIEIINLALLMNNGVVIGKKEVILVFFMILLFITVFILIVSNNNFKTKIIYLIPILYLIFNLSLYYSVNKMDTVYGDLNITPFTEDIID